MEVLPSDTIEIVKSRIQTDNELPPHKKQLLFAGNKLDDRKTLSDYAIHENSKLSLNCTSITLETLFGITTNILIELNKSVWDLKQRIEYIPHQYLRLFYAGNELEDERTLKQLCDKRITCLLKGDVRLLFVELSVPTLHSKICLQVVFEMHVFHIKAMIEQRKHIPVYLQTLMYDGELLDDSKCLKDYSLKENCTLQLKIETNSYLTNFSMTVSNIYDESDQVEITKLNPQHILNEVPEIMQYIEPQRNIYHEAVLLEANKSIQNLLIENKSILYVTAFNDFPLIIRRPMMGNVQVIGTAPDETVMEVKSKLDAVEHQLFMGSLSLPDHQTMNECGITPASELFLVYPGEVPLFIKTRFTEELVCCNPSCNVRELKQIISRALDISKEHQQLIFHQNRLSNATKKLKSYGISSGATIFLVVAPKELEIHVRLPSQSVLTLICSTDDNINDVKMKVELEEGVPFDCQILPFENDKMTLREANVKPGKCLQIQYHGMLLNLLQA